MVCFNQEGCNLVESTVSDLYLFGILGLFFFLCGAWSGSWMGGGIWILLKCCHSVEKPPVA